MFYNILKQACEEIQSDISVIKVAGILDRLQSWYKNLFDPEYKELVNKLREDSENVKINIKSLYRYIETIDNAIKNGDVGSYDYAIESIKNISKELVEGLSKLNVESNAVQDKKEVNISNYKAINVTPVVKEKEKVRITNALKRANVDDETISQIIGKLDGLLSAITINLLQGKILESGLAKENGNDRNGELWVTIETPEFKIPEFPYLMQVKGTVTDKFVRTYNPQPEASLRNLFWFRITPMQGTRQEKTAKQVSKQIEKISGTDLARVIMQAYQSFGVTNPSPELVGSTWAQIVLESGRNGNTINLINNNFGNVTAGNFDKKWNDKGWIDSDKDWVLLKSGLKFKSYPTPLEGAKEYIKTLAYLYPDSIKIKNSGDVMEDAKYLHTKNYFGNVPYENYGGPMQTLLKEFMNNVWPKIGSNHQIIQQQSQEQPKQEEHMQNAEKELEDLSNYLGIQLAAKESNITKIVVNAISREVLPKSKILIKVNSSDNDASIYCASAICDSLYKLIQAESSIHMDNEIEISAIIPGNTEKTCMAAISIIDVVKKAFNTKYNSNIEVSVRFNKESELKKLGVVNIDIIKESFIKKQPNGKYRVVSRKGKNLGEYTSKENAKKRLQQVEYFKHNKAEDLRLLARSFRDQGKSELCDEILLKIAKETEALNDVLADLSYSFIMRNLRKTNEDKAKEFQEAYKKAFDEGYENGVEDFDKVALFSAIKECGIEREELEKVD